jgi:hypothetical protein
VLRACRRLLKPGGGTAFFTIIVTPGLSRKAHRRAARLGPRAVASTRPLDALMNAAGYVDLEVVDVTADFGDTARAWSREFSHHEKELRLALGDELEERQSDSQDLIRGVEEGLLKRVLTTAAAPS